jgi:hypothetical protein
MAAHSWPRRARRAARGLAFWLMFSARAASAAEPTPGPLEFLYEPANVLVAGAVVEADPAGQIVFRVDAVLNGKAQAVERLEVQVPAWAATRVRTNEKYLFGYTLYGADTRHPGRLVPRRQGALMLVSVGLEPALLRDTPEARAILRLGLHESARSSRHALDLYLRALNAPDLALQYLAAAQIAVEPEVQQRLGATDRVALEAYARNPNAAPAGRRVLLEAAYQAPRRFGSTWAAGVASALVTTAPLDGYDDPAPGLGELVRTAFTILENSPTVLPAASLARWAHSDNPALAEAALLLLRRQARDAERPAIEQALGDPHLAPETRTFLLDHLRRLQLSGT